MAQAENDAKCKTVFRILIMQFWILDFSLRQT